MARATPRPTFFSKKYKKKLKFKSIGSIYKGRLKSLEPGIATRPKIVRHGVAGRPNTLGFGVAARPKPDFGLLIKVSWVRQGYKTQMTWVCAPTTPKQLGSGVPFRPQVSWVWKGMPDPSC